MKLNRKHYLDIIKSKVSVDALFEVFWQSLADIRDGRLL